MRIHLPPALLLLAPAAAVMAYALVLPFGLFLRYSTYEIEAGRMQPGFSLDAYKTLLTDRYEHLLIGDTLWMAGVVTLVSLLVGYPMAYALWRMKSRRLKGALMLIVFSSLLLSIVVRSYGWLIVLADRGPVNVAMMALGLTDEPVRLVYNLTGVVITMTHVFLPFVVFPIYSAMTRFDPAVGDAARDLGASAWYRFRRVTFPLTLPGVIAAAQICLTLSLGAFVTPAILGGGRLTVLAQAAYQATVDITWPMAAVYSLAIFGLCLAAVLLCQSLLMTRRGRQ